MSPRGSTLRRPGNRHENISPSLLRSRLRFLEEHGLIMRKRIAKASRYEYFLMPSGKALAPVLTEIGK